MPPASPLSSRPRPPWRPGVLPLVALLATVLVVSPVHARAEAGLVHVRLEVRPVDSLEDKPISVRVTGLSPGETITLSLTATDAEDMGWASSATFKADATGEVNLATSASLGGSYTGVEPMGIVASMTPADSGNEYFAWPWSAEEPMHLAVFAAGQLVASATLERRPRERGVTVDNENVATAGFVGQFWSPPGTARRPAVLLFGGAEGGLDGQLVAAGLANAGYPTLDIAYFGEPGLPSELSSIPLEYFATALRWLSLRPNVKASRIFVAGDSIGSEAALLLGVHYPNLVDGVIASVPDNFAFCALPSCNGPAWTYEGAAVPYTTYSDLTAVDHPDAIIPVQEVRGPIFLDCGGVDPLAPCSEAEAILTLLDAHGDPTKAVLHEYPDAGHGVGGLIPYDPGGGLPGIAGTSPQADAEAVARLWPALITWLAKASR